MLLEGRGQLASQFSTPVRVLHLELGSCLEASAFACWAISGLKSYYFLLVTGSLKKGKLWHSVQRIIILLNFELMKSFFQVILTMYLVSIT